MKLKFLFFFLALLLTAVWTILLVLTLKERGALFYIGEGVITFSLVFLVYFYRKVVKPLDIIGNGMELLREQDFSSRLTPVGQKEADRICVGFQPHDGAVERRGVSGCVSRIIFLTCWSVLLLWELSY